jgi:hypothetical protein
MRKSVSIKTSAIAITLAVILTASIVLAVLYQRQVTNTMRIVGGNFKLILGEDLKTEVTSITWGDFLPSDSKNSSTILGHTINIANLANIGLVFAWNYTGLDEANWTLTCKHSWSGSSGTNYPVNDFNQFGIAANSQNGYMVFYLTNIGGAMGEDGFTINFYSAKQV